MTGRSTEEYKGSAWEDIRVIRIRYVRCSTVILGVYDLRRLL
jgi:hypothetical protein